MRFRRTRKAKPGIDMSPLIDCIFQLLVFFMLSSSFAVPAIRLALPQASSQDPREESPVTVSVDAEGRIYLEARLVHAESLDEGLRAALAGRSEKSVNFRGDEAAPYSVFMTVTDAARRAGASRFLLAHEPVATGAGSGQGGNGR